MLGLGLLLGLNGSVWAQDVGAPASTAPWQTAFFETPAVALPLLQAAAVRHAAKLGALDKEKSIIGEDKRLIQKDILGSLALTGSYNYGNQTSGIINDPNSLSGIPANSTLRHSVGVNLILPLDRLAGRRNLIQKQELRYQQAELQRQAQEQDLRQDVIRLYQEVLRAKKSLALYQQAFLSADTDHELVERQFREGQVTLGDLSQVNSRYAQAAIAQEQAASQYETSFLLLEELAGGRISDLMTSK